MKNFILTIIFLYFIISPCKAQILYSDGGLIHINGGVNLYCNGGIMLTNSSQFINDGIVTSTKNSTLPQSGNFMLNTQTLVSGNGTYNIEQDWINDATFNGDNSEVILFGNSEQFITSTNGTSTTFNNLTLTGSGTNINRRKSLLNVDASTSSNGILTLNDRELSTDTNRFYVDNPNISSISNSNSFGNEGFVSSLTNGYLVRKTNQLGEYLFPVGSSDGTLRYRPVTINPNSTSNQQYQVRMNNYSADNENYLLSQHEDAIINENNLFFHSINRSIGNSDPNIKIYFIPSQDKDWASFAHWYPTEQKWKDVTNVTESSSSSFKYIEKDNWNFPTNGYQYVLVNLNNELLIPNVFTPNGDGVNDDFLIISSGLKDFQLYILNRWGEEVFKSNDPSINWDGTTKGKECSDGVYFYTLKAKQNTKEIVKQGFITLTRN